MYIYICVYIYKLNGGSKPIKITVGPPPPETGAASSTVPQWWTSEVTIATFSASAWTLATSWCPADFQRLGVMGILGDLPMEAMALIEIDGLLVNSMVIFHGKLLVITRW